MKQRRLGRNGPMTSAIGLGCMTMTSIYGAVDEVECIATIHAALDAGLNFLDSSDAYGAGANEEMIGRAIKGRREAALVATKFGNVRLPDGKPGGDGRPEYVIEACDKSLKRLGIDTIDIYFQHRVDRRVPIEETVGAMAGLVKAGKVRYLGLSEAAAATVRRAAAVHPICALQTEYSLWCRFAEDELLPTCRELGISYVAYSPLGRGFLTAGFKSLELAAREGPAARASALLRRELREERRAARPARGDGEAEGLHPGANRPRLAARRGRGHRADPRNVQAHAPRRQHCGDRGHAVESRARHAPGRDPADGRRRALPCRPARTR